MNDHGVANAAHFADLLLNHVDVDSLLLDLWLYYNTSGTSISKSLMDEGTSYTFIRGNRASTAANSVKIEINHVGELERGKKKRSREEIEAEINLQSCSVQGS